VGQKIETLLYNGKIFSPDKFHEAIGLADGKIVGVGNKRDFDSCVGPRTKLINLRGKTVLPGFNDAHIHLWLLMLKRAEIDVKQTKSISEILNLFKKKAQTEAQGKWIIGRGFQESNLKEKRLPNRYDLDSVTPRHPAVLSRTCYHIMVANSAALKMAGITRHTPDPQGGEIERDSRGEPTGVLREMARSLMSKVIPPHPLPFLRKLMREELDHQLSLGVTSATDARIDREGLELFEYLESRRQLPIRVNILYARYRADGTKAPLPKQFRRPFLKLKTVKFFADGGLSGATAALSIDYRNQPKGTRGILYFNDEQLLQEFREVHRAGLEIATHAIGDMAVEQVLSSYEKVLRERPRPNHRHRIEHFGLPTKSHIKRASQAKLLLVPQPIFIRDLGSSFLRYLPNSMFSRCYPIRDLLRAGCKVALSSDAPVVANNNPMRGLQSALDRLTPSGEAIAKRQAISLVEALKGFSAGGAYADGEEHFKGVLAKDYAADLCVLNRDPFTCPVEELSDIKVSQTFVDGKLVYANGGQGGI
jgi:predicted amidohydrolase YtcJ